MCDSIPSSLCIDQMSSTWKNVNIKWKYKINAEMKSFQITKKEVYKLQINKIASNNANSKKKWLETFG